MSGEIKVVNEFEKPAKFMKRKVYIETSVISYLTARPSKTILGAAHQQITLDWWDSRHQYVLTEIPFLMIDENAINIASELVQKGIVPSKAAEDALHIAIATIYGMDYLLTWNCRHIANPELQRSIAFFLEETVLFLPFICTPEELLGNENDER